MMSTKCCPFCGSDSKIYILKNLKDRASGYWVGCSNVKHCGVHTYVTDEESQAVAIWNNRCNEQAKKTEEE